MKLSSKAEKICKRVSGKNVKLGDLRTLAKEIKKDHSLALELWSTGSYFLRQLAILIMDAKLLTREVIDKLDGDMMKHPPEERNQLMDWLLANQLQKDKRIIALIRTWLDSPSSLQRRTYWYYQARLRWVGQTPPPDSEELLSTIEERIESEKPEVQWAMNFTAGQIGVFQPEYRSRCIALGEKTGLYRDEVVAKNCTPNYLPKFISIQVAKQK